jgi:hypothetical protein
VVVEQNTTLFSKGYIHREGLMRHYNERLEVWAEVEYKWNNLVNFIKNHKILNANSNKG